MQSDEGAAKQDPVMKRVYEAAVRSGAISKETPLTDLANKINQSAQTVKNWDSRGPSAQGLLQIQLTTGVSATWALTGEEPMLLKAPAKDGWPLSQELVDALWKSGREQRELVENIARSALRMPPAPINSLGEFQPATGTHGPTK